MARTINIDFDLMHFRLVTTSASDGAHTHANDVRRQAAFNDWGETVDSTDEDVADCCQDDAESMATGTREIFEDEHELDHQLKECTFCRLQFQRKQLSTCSGCLAAWYCSPTCQRTDWVRPGGHQISCVRRMKG